MMIVLLVIKRKTVMFVDLEIFHKVQNVLTNVKQDGGKIKINVLNVKQVAPNVEMEVIVKNVQEEKSY